MITMKIHSSEILGFLLQNRHPVMTIQCKHYVKIHVSTTILCMMRDLYKTKVCRLFNLCRIK